MQTKYRDFIYIGVFVANGVLVACQARGMIPAGWAQGAAMLSFLLAGAMKEFGAPEVPQEKDADK